MTIPSPSWQTSVSTKILSYSLSGDFLSASMRFYFMLMKKYNRINIETQEKKFAVTLHYTTLLCPLPVEYQELNVLERLIWKIS
jgi:hypothetical protein